MTTILDTTTIRKHVQTLVKDSRNYGIPASHRTKRGLIVGTIEGLIGGAQDRYLLFGWLKSDGGPDFEPVRSRGFGDKWFWAVARWMFGEVNMFKCYENTNNWLFRDGFAPECLLAMNAARAAVSARVLVYESDPDQPAFIDWEEFDNIPDDPNLPMHAYLPASDVTPEKEVKETYVRKTKSACLP